MKLTFTLRLSRIETRAPFVIFAGSAMLCCFLRSLWYAV
jgi:hypothetical protein